LRILVLVDGEHYPPVVAAAIDRLSRRLLDATVVGAALLGGTEKLAAGRPALGLELGVEVVGGATPDEALLAGLEAWRPDLVYDLSDEPVLDNRARLRLAGRALAAGAAYQGADFRFDAPPRPKVATKPSIAVIGTGKRTGKTAVSAHLARTLRERGTPPVVVAMGRGGPAAPELVDPAVFDLSVGGLMALAESGRHAASDHLEGAVMSGSTTVGTRRCGGGMAGAPADDTVAAGVALANDRPEPLVILEAAASASRPSTPTPPSSSRPARPIPTSSSGTSAPTACCSPT
jgi:cyclic 2,3-diphosphoglycerate synthase